MINVGSRKETKGKQVTEKEKIHLIESRPKWAGQVLWKPTTKTVISLYVISLIISLQIDQRLCPRVESCPVV